MHFLSYDIYKSMLSLKVLCVLCVTCIQVDKQIVTTVVIRVRRRLDCVLCDHLRIIAGSSANPVWKFIVWNRWGTCELTWLRYSIQVSHPYRRRKVKIAAL